MLVSDYRVPDTVAARAVADEVVLLDLEAGAFYSLNPTAAFVWSQFSEGAPRERIAAALAERYEVDAATAQSDVAALLGELQESGLLERV
jgi:hypothetical protein